jgi:hypothetical protein
VVETIRLESGHTLTGIVGSNPTLSATKMPSSYCGLRLNNDGQLMGRNRDPNR